MGNIISSIARGINAVLMAIVNVITTIVSAIANVLLAIWYFFVKLITCGKYRGTRKNVSWGKSRRARV
ncbi:hypothetical protein FFLO_01313 [Filobasidium floriforme]|uniref:Uncharacterized protein n=1 Tax=Filobasidium floriforme TaxID=5210 RepID=A0A8K0JPT7_9TREE|nr:uncharacterized protein HD553DRAFT_339529 [Filobasidium floriforme]KAG7566934.1 hypothetical protein FFLO_01313 [Filobasidium floriforme]KAH8089315.1 hypothetical protein HD553DRAFT_339529 [Filobasidium floriforme]